MLTKVQWADAFRRGLLADGEYISGLLEDHGGRLNFFPKIWQFLYFLVFQGAMKAPMKTAISDLYRVKKY